jgi:hypothetical protein
MDWPLSLPLHCAIFPTYGHQQVRFVDSNGQMLPEGGQAVFDMPDLQPAPVAPPAPKIYFDSPSSSGDDVLVKFEIADYDLARDGPASIVLDSRLKALVAESPCTLVRSQPAPLSHSAPISYRGGT